MKLIFFVVIITLITNCNHYSILKTGLEGNLLPSLEMQVTDSITHLNTATIPKGEETVLFFFEPYCRVETEEIISNIKHLSNIQICLLTNSPLEKARAYSKQYKLGQYTNITVGIDTTNHYANYFKSTGVPYLAIYDTQRKLKQVLIGKTDVDYIKEVALE